MNSIFWAGIVIGFILSVVASIVANIYTDRIRDFASASSLNFRKGRLRRERKVYSTAKFMHDHPTYRYSFYLFRVLWSILFFNLGQTAIFFVFLFSALFPAPLWLPAKAVQSLLVFVFLMGLFCYWVTYYQVNRFIAYRDRIEDFSTYEKQLREKWGNDWVVDQAPSTE